MVTFTVHHQHKAGGITADSGGRAAAGTGRKPPPASGQVRVTTVRRHAVEERIHPAPSPPSSPAVSSSSRADSGRWAGPPSPTSHLWRRGGREKHSLCTMHRGTQAHLHQICTQCPCNCERTSVHAHNCTDMFICTSSQSQMLCTHARTIAQAFVHVHIHNCTYWPHLHTHNCRHSVCTPILTIILTIA